MRKLFNRQPRHEGEGRYFVARTVADDYYPIDLPIEQAREIADGTGELIAAIREGRDLLGSLTVAEIVALEARGPLVIPEQPKSN